MKVQKTTANKIDRYKPATGDFTPLDFHKIPHTILENTATDTISSYGKFSCQFDFVHDFADSSIEYNKPTHSKTTTIKDNALDLRLTSIANFREKGKGIDKVRRTLRQRGVDTNWLDDAKEWFKSEVKARIVNRKAPMYYTSGIKHKKTTDYLEQAICMIIETEEQTSMFVSIGEVRYQFDFAVEKTDSQLRVHHTISAYDIDFDSEDDFDFDMDEELYVEPTRIPVESSCELRYELEDDKASECTLDELKDVLASLDDDFELEQEELERKQQRLHELHDKRGA